VFYFGINLEALSKASFTALTDPAGSEGLKLDFGSLVRKSYTSSARKKEKGSGLHLTLVEGSFTSTSTSHFH